MKWRAAALFICVCESSVGFGLHFWAESSSMASSPNPGFCPLLTDSSNQIWWSWFAKSWDTSDFPVQVRGMREELHPFSLLNSSPQPVVHIPCSETIETTYRLTVPDPYTSAGPLVLSPQSSLQRPSRHIKTEQSLTCYGARTSHCNSPLPSFPMTTELSSHFFVLMDSSAMLLSQNKTSFFSGHRGLCIAVFTPSWYLGTWEVFAGSGRRVRRSCLGSCGLRAWPAPEGGNPPEPPTRIPCWGARWCQQTARQVPWCLEHTDPYQRYEVPY